MRGIGTVRCEFATVSGSGGELGSATQGIDPQAVRSLHSGEFASAPPPSTAQFGALFSPSGIRVTDCPDVLTRWQVGVSAHRSRKAFPPQDRIDQPASLEGAVPPFPENLWDF